MRVKKSAVRSWLNRNGVLNLELFNFAPDKTSRWQIVHRPRHRAWGVCFITLFKFQFAF